MKLHARLDQPMVLDVEPADASLLSTIPAAGFAVAGARPRRRRRRLLLLLLLLAGGAGAAVLQRRRSSAGSAGSAGSEASGERYQPQPDELIDSSAAASVLQQPEDTIATLVTDGVLTPIETPSGPRFRAAEVQALRLAGG